MICAAIADGRTLARVVVLKALSKQMFNLLILRLGNLLNRRVIYLPFSRRIKVDESRLQLIDSLLKGAAQDGAVLVVQPEHLLSLKLMSVERLITSTNATEEKIAHQLAQVQDWLSISSRDILDESDELLHVQYQLVYTAGVQQVR
jgi:hypothetical protein